jgi:hypothetical protein
MKVLAKFWHWLLHLTSQNRCHVETRWDGDHLMVGFRCTCGELRGEFEAQRLGDEHYNLIFPPGTPLATIEAHYRNFGSIYRVVEKAHRRC